MTIAFRRRKVAIIGAGPAGSLMAIHLARRGHDVDIYERRGDLRTGCIEGTRSINLTLAGRGLRALAEVGILDTVLPATVPLKGRVVHGMDGMLTFQPYGKDDREVLYAIRRSELNGALLDMAQSLSSVHIFFNKRCTSLDRESGTICFQDEQTGRSLTQHAEHIIGADGAFSTVRQHMQHGERANYRQEFLAWGYKELRIPAGPGGTFAMEKNALHVWPRGDRMLLAIPNRDGSFTCTCILPFQGEDSFASLRSDAQVRSFMHAQFGDVASLMPTLIDDFTGHRTAEFVTIRTSPWHYKDRVVLIGDACHAVYPFYGQGMNAAFEDCSELNQCLGRHEEDWGAAFEAFYGLRKRNTDVLADLSRENFVELRDTVRSPILVTRKKVTAEIHRRFPKVCVPLYTLVTHTTMPYAEALARAQRQDRMLRWLGLDVVVLVGATALALRHPVQTLARTGSRFPRVAPVRFRVSHWTRSLPRSPLVAAPVRQGPLARGTWRDMQQIQSLAQLHGQPVASTLRAVQVWNHRALDGVEPIDATLPAPATLRDARPALPGSAAAR